MGEWEPAQLAACWRSGDRHAVRRRCASDSFLQQRSDPRSRAVGDGNRLRAWLLAMAVAIFSTQLLLGFAIVDVRKAVYLTAPLNLAALVIGGLMFGIGMMLAQGCAARNLVRLGGGNLRAWSLSFSSFAVTAYATMRGILAPGRVSRWSPDTRQFQRCRRAGTPCRDFRDPKPNRMRWIVALGAAGGSCGVLLRQPGLSLVAAQYDRRTYDRSCLLRQDGISPAPSARTNSTRCRRPASPSSRRSGTACST